MGYGGVVKRKRSSGQKKDFIHTPIQPRLTHVWDGANQTAAQSLDCEGQYWFVAGYIPHCRAIARIS